MEYLILSLASISLGSVVVVTAYYHPVGSQFDSRREHSIIMFALRWGAEVGSIKIQTHAGRGEGVILCKRSHVTFFFN